MKEILIKPFSILILLLVLGCQGNIRSDHSRYEKHITPGVRANMEESVKYNLITVEIGAPKAKVEVSEHDLYGKFFKNRAEFYIVENPRLYISNTEVKELTLYFIDGVLCKKKYELTDDIGTELMKSFGGFKFKALNGMTKDLSKKERIVFKTESGNVINDRFSSYQMKWDQDDLRLKYAVFKDSIEIDYHLTEELTAYSRLLRAAELEI